MSAIGERLSGAEVLERDLRVDDAHHADLVAVDVRGRLTLALISEHAGEELFLATVAAVTFARSNRDALALHLGARTLRSELEPLVIVAAQSFDANVLARLMTLDPAVVSCCELRTVESRRGRSHRLVPVRTDAPAARAPASELAEVTPLELLDARLSRIDEELSATSESGARAWHWHEQTLCTIQIDEARPRGSVSESGELFELDVAGEAERFLDAVVGRYVALAVSVEDTSVTPVGSELSRLQAAASLSAEEIAAFQEG